jgi:hypothetical protein
MLPLMLALLAADSASPYLLRIQASEPEATLSVEAAVPGWSRTCPTPVTVDRPCEISGAPAQRFVNLRISGTRAFESKLFLGTATTTVRIEHQGYAKTATGLVLVLGAIAVIAAGVNTFRDGDETTGRTLVSIGAGLESLGLILIISDVTGTHDRAVVVE